MRELRLFYAARRVFLKEKLDGKTHCPEAWKQEYAQLKTEYAELSPLKATREEVTCTAGAERRRYRTAPEGAATGSTEKET